MDKELVSILANAILDYYKIDPIEVPSPPRDVLLQFPGKKVYQVTITHTLYLDDSDPSNRRVLRGEFKNPHTNSIIFSYTTIEALQEEAYRIKAISN